MTTRRTAVILALSVVAYAVASAFESRLGSIIAIDALSAFAAGFAWWGALRQRHRVRAAWTLIAVGLTLWLIGDIMWDYYVIRTGEAPSASIADLAYLLAYPVLAVAVVMMIRQRATDHWRAGLMDAVGVALAAGLASWLFLVPGNTADPLIDQALAVAYPLADVVLLAALIWLVLAPGIRSLPSAMALTGIVGLLVLDVAEQIRPVINHPVIGPWVDNAYPLVYMAIAMSICHRRSLELTLPDPEPDDRLQPARVVFLTSALFCGPVIGTVRSSDTSDDRYIVLAVTITIGTIVMMRFVGALRELETSRAALTVVAGTDALTGLDNRRRFLEATELSVERLVRDGSPSGALMIDIDHFKQINDTYGHRAGDIVLAEVSRRLGSTIRPFDLLGRLGGDEFSLLLPGCDLDETTHIAIRLQQLVSSTPFDLGPATGNQLIDVHLSIGAAARRFSSIHDALAEADAALYEAKRHGRNQLWVGAPSVPVPAA